MTTTAIYISGGNVQGVYKVHNAPHSNLIVIDDDILGHSDDRIVEADSQLEGIEVHSDLDYNELHSELSNFVSSEEILKWRRNKVFVPCTFSTQYVSVGSASVVLTPDLKKKILALQQVVVNNPVLEKASCFVNEDVIDAFFTNSFSDELEASKLMEDDYYASDIFLIAYRDETLILEIYSDNDDEKLELDVTKLLELI